MIGHHMARDQVLGWNDQWLPSDVETIRANVDRVGGTTFYVPPSGGYINVVTDDGRIAMTVHPGYLEFKSDTAPTQGCESGWPGVLLSTFRPHASPTYEDDESTAVCPRHLIALPVSGICDECQ